MEMRRNCCRERETDICSIPQDKCSLAMAYVPIQNWEEMYSEEKALEVGTVFPSLNFPFLGKGIIK